MSKQQLELDLLEAIGEDRNEEDIQIENSLSIATQWSQSDQCGRC